MRETHCMSKRVFVHYLCTVHNVVLNAYYMLIIIKFNILGNVHTTVYFTYIVLYIMLHPMLYIIIVQVHLVMLKTERILPWVIGFGRMS